MASLTERPATPVRAPRGTELSCKGWPQEAALRMLMNNLDPDVAERWEDLVVYGGSGKAARSWEAYHTIVRTLRRLEGHETLLVQSGKPVGVFKTHPDAPRVLIANALLVPEWGDWEHFRRYEAMGLTMYGQMTAGSWIYIGTQGILQGTYETFGACARQHFGGSLAGRLVLSAGLGGMGGAQPLAVTLNGGVGLFVEVDRERIERRLRLRYVDRATSSLDEALRWADEARARREPLSIFDYGNNFRRAAENAGVTDFSYPGFVPAFIRPLFCEGQGPFRWVALSGDPEDIFATDRALIEAMPENESLVRWLRLARERVGFQGLPARICWLGYGDRARAGKIFNDLVARGVVQAPIVIGRDHLDSGSVASPNRETESMRDGSDAIADWPVLNALLNTASGATWVSVHHGGGVGIGYSIHAGMVVVADGSPDAARRLERVLTTDPGTGIMRHADAGYPEAIAGARRHGLDLPGITS